MLGKSNWKERCQVIKDGEQFAAKKNRENILSITTIYMNF